MKILLPAFLVIITSLMAYSQPSSGLIAYYQFENDLTDSQGNVINEGIPLDEPSYGCGITGQSLNFNGGTDEVRFDGQVREGFNTTNNFTLSLYFKANTNSGEMYLISKSRTNCEEQNVFFIKYQALSRTINVFLKEEDNREINIIAQLSNNACWHHLVVTRNGGTVRVYGDGRFLREESTIGRIDLANEGNLVLGASDCARQNELPFNGVMDELRVYNRGLSEDEIRELYVAPERIATRDTVVFLGNPVQMSLTANCANRFEWFPSSGVSQTNAPNPEITPFAQGDNFYSVQLTDASSGCVASDSIRITVVDPTTLDCSEVYLPNVFTPNNDGVNDTYGISNPYAIQELISFEIFDRWGSRVFATGDPFNRWDGTYRSKKVNPGVLQYKVRYTCRGEEQERFGTLMVMR
ncbi:MAG TPA: LamG-like jellyroll fold domain-containing protein [Saprospiraceae bacterium]|nr:LamG-like jellyroll fold domain-containing protein [Saprospiraceae bacterium]